MHSPEAATSAPPAWSKGLHAIRLCTQEALMIPIRNAVPSRYPAVITWTLIAINCAVFLFQDSLSPDELELFVREFALIPANYTGMASGESVLSGGDFLPFLSMMFLHGGWVHLMVEEGALDDLDTRIKQIDAAIDESTRRGRPAVAMAVGNSLHRTRNQLSVNRQQETVALAGLQVEESQIEAQLKRARSEVGPVRYLAELLGGSSVDLERAVRILTLAVVGVLDPLAITLLIAAASQPSIRGRVARKIHRRDEKNHETNRNCARGIDAAT
jgi:hypothetical protein